MKRILEIYWYRRMPVRRATDIRLAIWIGGSLWLSVYEGWISIGDTVIPRKRHLWS